MFESMHGGILTAETGNLVMSQVQQKTNIWHLYDGKFGCANLSRKWWHIHPPWYFLKKYLKCWVCSILVMVCDGFCSFTSVVQLQHEVKLTQLSFFDMKH